MSQIQELDKLSATHRCYGLHVANHKQPLYGGLIMTDLDIQKSKHLLKSLKEQMSFLSSLMAQADVVCSNLQGMWNAVRVAHESWEKDIEKH